MHDLYDAVLAHGPREKRIERLEKPRKPVVVLATQPEPAASCVSVRESSRS